MKEMEKLLNLIKETEFAKIVDFAEMDDNGHFKDYEYFTIEKENMFFYIQYSKFDFNTNYTITPYLKINWNKKQQCGYPIKFFNNNQFTNIIEDLINKHYRKDIKNAHIQRINLDFDTYYMINNEKITLINYLNKIAGYREKEILKDLKGYEMLENNKNYRIFKLYNSNNDYININTKNINRLIVG